MEFLNEQGQKITLKRSEILPGYEITVANNVTIDSPVNNPFFKGINVLQLSKKLKGFRDNPDLQKLLEPKRVNTDIKLDLADNQFAIFEPDKSLTNKKLQSINYIFGNNMTVAPTFVNFGLKNIKLNKGDVIGTIIIHEAVI